MNGNYAMNNHSLLSDEKKENPLVTVLLTFLILIMGAILICMSLFQLFRVKGDSMMNSYFNHDFVLLQKNVNNIAYKDVVIIDAPRLDKNNNVVITRLIKRVIATEGETFKFEKQGSFIKLLKIVNGKLQLIDEPYIKEDMKLTDSFLSGKFQIGVEYTVPKNQFLFLGDNRNISQDGRYYGFLNVSTIVASKVVYTPPQGSVAEFFLKLIFGGFTQLDENKIILDKL